MSVFSDVREIAAHYGFSRADAVDGLRMDDFMCVELDEAHERARDYITQTLWAFQPSFLVGYCEGDIPESAVTKLQELCEDANDAILALVGNNLDSLIEDAIGYDGLGHFLSSYDGECIDLGSGRVAWRVN